MVIQNLTKDRDDSDVLLNQTKEQLRQSEAEKEEERERFEVKKQRLEEEQE